MGKITKELAVLLKRSEYFIKNRIFELSNLPLDEIEKAVVRRHDMILQKSGNKYDKSKDFKKWNDFHSKKYNEPLYFKGFPKLKFGLITCISESFFKWKH